MKPVVKRIGGKYVVLNTKEEVDEFYRKEREEGEKLFRILKEKREQRRAQNSVTNDSHLRVEDENEHLLPGLPNEITFQEIVPKLPWQAFHSLSAVSRCWKRAIRSHKVFDARVRSNSTEPLFVLDHIWDDTHRLCLYSVRDKSWYQFPPFPHTDRVPEECQWISLDGKIYVLGGGTEKGDYYSNVEWAADHDSREVFVLDLAGQREWKQCANMLEPRQNFGCGVMNGKIYVFGGDYEGGCEVYDPKENAWSSITPMKFVRCGHQVEIVGEELFVLGGEYCERDGVSVEFAEAYHPGKGEWRLVNPFSVNYEGRYFSSKGNLFEMSNYGIFAREVDSEEWSFMHDYSFPEDFCLSFVFASYVVEDELFALVSSTRGEIVFLHSRDFDGEDEEIRLEKLDCSLPCSSLGSRSYDSFMCPMRL